MGVWIGAMKTERGVGKKLRSHIAEEWGMRELIIIKCRHMFPKLGQSVIIKYAWALIAMRLVPLRVIDKKSRQSIRWIC